MKLLGWVFLLVSLGVVGAGAYLYYAYPFLEVPSPFGPLPLYALLPGAYFLGLLMGGFGPWPSGLEAWGKEGGLYGRSGGFRGR
jgi:hypothetical protein